MKSRNSIVMAGIATLLPLAAWAQGGGYTPPLPGLPATEWEAAYAKPVDGEAEVDQAMWYRLTGYSKAIDPATPADKRRFIGEADAVETVRALRYDGKLDAAEIDLLEELALPRERSIQIQQSGNAKTRVAIRSIPGLMQPAANELGAMWRTEWDEAESGGWAVLLKADAKSAGHEGLRQRLVMGGRDHFARAVIDSNVANRYAPFRDAILKVYTVNAKLPAADQARGKLLLHDAAAFADSFHGGAMPDFLYSWLKPAS